MQACCLLTVILLGGACGDDAPAGGDAGVDSSVDAGRCGGDVFLTAELVDWDSTEDDFLGVFEARFTVQGIPAATATTAPNGRFELCVPQANPLLLDVDAPAPYIDGVTVVEGEILLGSTLAFRPISLRTFSATRAETFYDGLGLAYDPGRAHLLVLELFDRVELSIDRSHDPAQAANDDGGAGVFTWAAGTTGRYVLFPNVDVAEPSALLTGDQVEVAVPVAAGQLSLAVVHSVFL